MWIFTNFGFFSVVKKGSPGNLMVRARERSDLENLINKHGDTLGVTVKSITVTPEADYCCRVEVPQEAWSATLSNISNDIDYDNFKDSVYENQGYERAHVYTSVWSTMYNMQLFGSKR